MIEFVDYFLLSFGSRRYEAGGALFHKTMADFLMAVETGNVVFGDVILVDKRDVVETGEFFRLVMASKATVLLRLSFSLDHIEMAVFAINMLGSYKILVVVYHVSNLEVLCWKIMTAQTTSNGLEFSSFPSSLEMAQIASVVGYFNMFANDYLGMARYTTEVPTALYLSQMGTVIKLDSFFGYQWSFEKPVRMASRAQTGTV